MHAVHAVLRQRHLELDDRAADGNRLEPHEGAAATDVADISLDFRPPSLAQHRLQLRVETRVGPETHLPAPEDFGQPLARQLIRVVELRTEFLAAGVGYDGA